MESNKNKYGNISFGISIVAILLNNFIVISLLAIFFGYIGMRDARRNPLLSKWQARTGFILGILSLIAFISRIIPTYNP
ncbi:MAG: hypothetical protein ACM3XR_02155 [Bacillota bacterium]